MTFTRRFPSSLATLTTTAFAAVVFWRACGSAAAHEYGVVIPSPADWIDCGAILDAGAAGDWDRILWGGFAATVLKREDSYHLYYQGSDGYHETEHTVTHRAIGLAISDDGLRFTRHPRNPVINFSARGNHEEGAVSSAAFVDEMGRVVMYYGANTWAGGLEVTADARLAVADDGVRFTEHGVFLDHSDTSVWGWGDELFPMVAFQHGERRAIYYIPNGTAQGGQLGVAWTDRDARVTSRPALSGRRSVRAWGPGSAAAIGADVYALFLAYSRGPVSFMEVRTVAPLRPDALSAPVHRYEWQSRAPMAVLLDHDRNRWLLYYRDAAHEHYGVMTAAARSALTSSARDGVGCGLDETGDESRGHGSPDTTARAVGERFPERQP